MYQIVKTLIESGGFDLTDMCGRIEVLFARGQLTEEESAELIDMAREHVEMAIAYPELSARVTELEVWRRDVEARLKKLEEDTGEVEPEPDPEPEDEYPAWHTPTGAHDAYYKDDKMTYTDGKKYVCIAPDGYGVTYGPDVLPGMWKVVE